MHKGTLALFGLLFVASGARPGCSTSTTVHGIFVAPTALNEISDEHFFDHPFPSDYRRDPDGTVHLEGMYNPTFNDFIQQYEDVTIGLFDGFSPAAAAYFTFDGDLDTSTFPQQPTDALSPTSTIQLIDVDPTSPEHGQRKLLQWYFRNSTDPSLYWIPDTLAIAPAQGYPLRPHTRYALVVTRGVASSDGGAVLPSRDLLEVLDLLPVEPHAQAVHDLFAPAIAELASVGVSREQMVQLTVFTTNDPTEELFKLIDAVKTDFPPPTVDPTQWHLITHNAVSEIYEGIYGPSPNYQAGLIPFQNAGDGGGFVFDANGHPVLQSTFNEHFSLVVPVESQCPMPPNGYPLALYAHGTGGNFESVWQEEGGFGTTLPPLCVAAMGVDQIFQGLRPGAPPAGPNYENEVDLLFFNVFNPVAARTNGRQGAVDILQQARLITESHATIPSLVTIGGRTISFDPTRLVFVGHSEGGVNGPLYLAASDETRGGVLSGTGAMITVALLEKTQPAPSVAQLVRTLLSLDQYPDELGVTTGGLLHPVMNLVQTLVDTTDPLHYMGYIIQHPRHGVPKSIYQTEGIALGGACMQDSDCPMDFTCNPQNLCEDGDSYAPPDGIEIASVALGLPRELPGVRPIPADAWSGIMDVTVPSAGLSANLANGMASGVLGQFPPPLGDDGHFVVFDVPACQQQAAHFMANLAGNPLGLVPPLPQ
jgi:hypothetical protein